MSPAVAYRSLKMIKDNKIVPLEVIAVTYERCSFTWCFGLVFADERWSHVEFPLFLFVL